MGAGNKLLVMTNIFCFQVNGAAQFVGESNSAPHGLARNSGITYLNANDKVRIEILKGHLEGGWKDSTFSGYLLYEERL